MLRLQRLSSLLLTGLLLGFFGLLSYCLYKISGRATPADGVRPFVVLLLWWWAALICYRLRFRLYARVLNLLAVLSAFLTVLFFVYYRRINSFITGDDMAAVMQSNPEEQLDFLFFNILTPSALLWSGAAAACGLLLYELLFFFVRTKDRPVRRRWLLLLCAVIFQIGAAVIVTQLRPVKFYFMMKEEYARQIEIFNEVSSKVQRTAAVPAHKAESGELYVLVLGESLNRDLMGCYNGFLDNTPFLSQLTADPLCVRFDNAYAAFVNTMPAVTNAFSQGNLLRGLTFPYGENLFALLRTAGVKSAWISNQVRQSKFDTPIAALADKADFQYFSINLSEGSSKQQRPDAYLLPVIDEYLGQASVKDNHLLVIHLMGNHSPYDHRYPGDFTEYDWSGESMIGCSDSGFDARRELNQYLTSVRYNDAVLEQIYRRCASRPDFAAMLYLSDHAEEVTPPGGRHNIGQFSFTMTRVPLILKASELYAERYPQAFRQMQANAELPFTNDCLYDWMLGLMQIKTEACSADLSLTAADYVLNFENARIIEDKRLTDDPLLSAKLNLQEAERLGLPQLLLTEPQSLFRTAAAINQGVQALMLEVRLQDGEAVLAADPSLTAADFVQQLPRFEGQVLLRFTDEEDPKLQSALSALAQDFADRGGVELIALTSPQPELKGRVSFALESQQVPNDDLPAGYDYALVPCSAAVQLSTAPEVKLMADDCKLQAQAPDFLSQLRRLKGLQFAGGTVCTAFDLQE